jgi:RNA polymerase sigma-54 factor
MGGGPQTRLGLNLKVAQKQILTPGLVQMVSVLALNKLELREMINQEMVMNPVLEELPESVATLDQVAQKTEQEKPGEPSADVDVNNGDKHDSFEEVDFGAYFQEYLDPAPRSPEKEAIEKSSLESFLFENSLPIDPANREFIEKPSFENFLSKPASLADHLEWQLSLSPCTEAIRDAGSSIIGNLNEDGYLPASLEEIAASGNHGPEDVEKALALIQEFDPPGVAARDVRECLLIQLRVLAPRSALPQQIVSDHLKLLEGRQLKEIARALDRPLPVVERAVELIRSLDPRPGQRYNRFEPNLVEPDVAFVKTSDGYEVRINEDGMPQLRLSPQYRRMLEGNNTSREVRTYVKERFTAALQLLKNIEQRKQTIVRVCEAIIRRQQEYLDKGMDSLKPMMIKEVAEEVGVHPSTVSRAVSHKYAQTPLGVIELRTLFSESVQGPSGGATSLVNLKRLVKKMIEEEEPANPLTDEQITTKLREAGINVTRRSVAKYREDMRIPSTHQRRVKA